MDKSKSQPPKEIAGSPRGRYPGLMVWSIVVLALAGLVIVRSIDPWRDIAWTNVATLILGFIAVFTLLVWFVGFSSYRKLWRGLTVGGVVAAITLFFVFFRIEGVAGDLLPRFGYRFARPRHARLAPPKVEHAGTVDLAETTPGDFPGFLGPDRNGVLQGPKLARNWQEQPPRQLWKQPIGAGWSAFAAVNGFAVTMEQRGQEELVTCYEIETGKLCWSHAEPGLHETILGGVGPRSTPTIHNGRVFALGATGRLLCLNGGTGEVLWRFNLLEAFGSDPASDLMEVAWGRANSPLIVDDLVVVPAGGKGGQYTSLVALNQETGEVAWRGGQRQVSYASPSLATLAGVRQIVSVHQDAVAGHDPQTGAELWSARWPGKSNADASASQAQTPGDDLVLLSKGYSHGSELLRIGKDARGKLTAETIWRKPQRLLTKFTNVAIVNGFAYALSDGLLECVEVETGDVKWKGRRRRLGDFGQGQILAVGDVLLVQAEHGEVVMVEASPQRLNELGRFQALEGQTWNNLCLYGNRLLVRNAEQAACYELAVE